ncbi:hypothetical protein [Sphingobium sp. MI1205]|nr:hypothetical protein [Sphingobium sp. MI1205]
MARQGKRFKASPQDYIGEAARSNRKGASAVLSMLRRFKDRQDKGGAAAP